MTRYKSSWRKRLELAPVLKKWDLDRFQGISTRSALRNLLFNTSKPKDDSIEIK